MHGREGGNSDNLPGAIRLDIDVSDNNLYCKSFAAALSRGMALSLRPTDAGPPTSFVDGISVMRGGDFSQSRERIKAGQKPSRRTFDLAVASNNNIVVCVPQVLVRIG